VPLKVLRQAQLSKPEPTHPAKAAAEESVRLVIRIALIPLFI
jgi:hypothetical protein